MAFNSIDSTLSTCPCVPNCPNRNAYCHSNCEEYKKWQIAQKHYSNKVKWLKKQAGYGVKWNALKR